MKQHRLIRPGVVRPVRRRRTARLLVLDPTGRILLFADSDPLLAGSHWWITPGGGVDPGESDRQAAVRELWEETGLRIAETDLIGPVAHRFVVHGYSDVIVDQDEVYFAVRCDPFEVSTAGHTAEELASFTGHRWWTETDLTTTTEPVWPVPLPQLLAAAQHPGAPLRLPDSEESVVPDDRPGTQAGRSGQTEQG